MHWEESECHPCKSPISFVLRWDKNRGTDLFCCAILNSTTTQKHALAPRHIHFRLFICLKIAHWSPVNNYSHGCCRLPVTSSEDFRLDIPPICVHWPQFGICVWTHEKMNSHEKELNILAIACAHLSFWHTFSMECNPIDYIFIDIESNSFNWKIRTPESFSTRDIERRNAIDNMKIPWSTSIAYELFMCTTRHKC